MEKKSILRGEGERKGTDWEGGGSFINTRGENRKEQQYKCIFLDS